MKVELHLPNLQFKDNAENHEVVKSLMLHGHDLDIEFSVDYRGLPLAIITTSGVKRFSYWLNRDSLEWRDRGLRDQAEQGRCSRVFGVACF